MKMKSSMLHFSKRQIVCSIVTVLSLVLFLIVTIWSGIKVKNLPDQHAAERWDKEGNAAQVSCYFAENAVVDEFQIMSFRKQFENRLMEILPQEQTIKTDERRLFADAYSSMGTITVTSDKGQLSEVTAVGIGGDFFLFHPLQLVSGQYFSGNDLMKDSIIIDEEAAWQLFGSGNIAGKSVMIGEVPHYIAGVIKRPEGRFEESAGLDKTVVYVSLETLSAYGNGGRISSYEIVAPNPVKHFVYTAIKENLGVAESDMIVVENSSRYSVEALIPVVLDFGTRSMQHAAVQLPYWENIARGWEDVMAMVTLWQGILLVIPAIIIGCFLWLCWKNKTWTWRDVYGFMSDRAEKFSVWLKEHKKDSHRRKQTKSSKGEEI